jgi:hypothetical protein
MRGSKILSTNNMPATTSRALQNAEFPATPLVDGRPGKSAAAQIPKRPAEFFHLHKCLREGPNQLRLDLKGGQLNLKSGRTLK